MNKFAVLGVTTILLGGFITPSFAETIRINARSGANTAVYSYSLYNPTTCASMVRPKVKFRQPKHGKFSFKSRSGKITAGKRCAGKTIKGVQIFYRANSGYRGADSGKISLSMPKFVDGEGYSHRSVTVKISVK